MRTLKFRAWNGEQMVSPDYISRDGTAWWKENSIPTSSKIVMQFTGLLDKNGKDVYEGDIVIVPTAGVPYNMVVKWHDKHHCFGLIVQGMWHKSYNSSRLYIIEKCEVIGNIYQNPDLLP